MGKISPCYRVDGGGERIISRRSRKLVETKENEEVEKQKEQGARLKRRKRKEGVHKQRSIFYGSNNASSVVPDTIAKSVHDLQPPVAEHGGAVPSRLPLWMTFFLHAAQGQTHTHTGGDKYRRRDSLTDIVGESDGLNSTEKKIDRQRETPSWGQANGGRWAARVWTTAWWWTSRPSRRHRSHWANYRGRHLSSQPGTGTISGALHLLHYGISQAPDGGPGRS